MLLQVRPIPKSKLWEFLCQDFHRPDALPGAQLTASKHWRMYQSLMGHIFMPPPTWHNGFVLVVRACVPETLVTISCIFTKLIRTMRYGTQFGVRRSKSQWKKVCWKHAELVNVISWKVLVGFSPNFSAMMYYGTEMNALNFGGRRSQFKVVME